MGTWRTTIDGNDTFQDIYQQFLSRYNEGQEPAAISRGIREDFGAFFEDEEDRNNALFALVQAQWETKSLDPELHREVAEIIGSGQDLAVWKSLGADNKMLAERKAALDKFLAKLGTERKSPKRRVKPKFDFTLHDLVRLPAPDGRKTLAVSEEYVNGAYTHTGAVLSWDGGGGSVFYYTAQGLHLSARWIDSQTLEITHDRKIVFTKKNDRFFYCGDSGEVIYIPV